MASSQWPENRLPASSWPPAPSPPSKIPNSPNAFDQQQHSGDLMWYSESYDDVAKGVLKFMEDVLNSQPSYRALLSSRGEKAQRFLDLMQKLLDSRSNMQANLRRSILAATLRLCVSSGAYPVCLILRGIQRNGLPVTEGRFGEIWKGVFRGREVCLKVIKLYQKSQVDHLIKKFAREAIMWSQLTHPNLLPFYGIYHLDDQFGRVCLVSPWMSNGNISEYLKENPDVPRLPLIHGILTGLAHLHEHSIIHGDLKGANILITSTGDACLADFGLSSVIDADILQWTSLETASPTGGTLRWEAPELIDDSNDNLVPRPTLLSDIYSMASVMYEVLAGKIPFYECPRDATVISRVIRGMTPTRPSSDVELELSDEIWGVMQECWSYIPSKRPTVFELLAKLQRVPPTPLTVLRMSRIKRQGGTGWVASRVLSPPSFRAVLRDGNLRLSASDLKLLQGIRVPTAGEPHENGAPPDYDPPPAYGASSYLPSSSTSWASVSPFHQKALHSRLGSSELEPFGNRSTFAHDRVPSYPTTKGVRSDPPLYALPRTVMHPAYLPARFLICILSAVVVLYALLRTILRRHYAYLGCSSLHVFFFGIIVSAAAVGALSSYRRCNLAKQLGARTIPCAAGRWPGNIDILLRLIGAFRSSCTLDVYLDLFKEHQCTTLNLRILWIDNIISMDQEHAKFMFATGFGNFWRGRAQKGRMKTLLGRGIFNCDDDIWKLHRSISRPFFAQDRFLDFEIFENCSLKVFRYFSNCASKNEACEIQDIYSRFALDIASEFLFGENPDTLSALFPLGKTAVESKGPPISSRASGENTETFETAKGHARISGCLWPFLNIFDKDKKHANAISQWLDPLVRRGLADKSKREASTIVESSIVEKYFLQHLMESTENPVLIRDQLVNMLFVSRDSTACVLTYITYFMATHPEVAPKMRAEILEICGPHMAPTHDRMRQLRYTRAVINETLRLYPPVPLHIRESRSSHCLLPPPDPSYPPTLQQTESSQRQPLLMPANTAITYLPFLTQRNPALWGKDADRFDPERWLDPQNLANFTSNPFMFTPFGAGPRICIGQNYAYNEITYFLVRLLQQFDRFELAPGYRSGESSLKERCGVEKLWLPTELTLSIKDGLWVRFHKADAEVSPP